MTRPDPAGRDPIRVLIADDDPEVRAALAEVISDEPGLALVGRAADATEAVALASELRPDVALLDVMMPGGGGPEAARGILACSPRTRVIGLSAYDDRESVMQMLRAGAVGYLVKGASIDDIVRAIGSAVVGGGPLSPEVTAGVIEALGEKLRGEDHESRRRREQERRIRKVLESEGVLDVVFQPIVDLGTREVAGVEALARFRTEPSTPPDRWFAEAAEAGLAVELELAAAERALTSVHDLPEGAYLSLNLSPTTATSAAFHRALERMPLDRLVIEVTEHAHVGDYEALGVALAPLRRGGGRLAVDDAGAGFASLRHILHLEPDVIKLDATLTRRIDRQPAHRALGAALISFANEIGATIVAEGIESESELEALTALGVSYGQGFHLARPGRLPDVVASLADRASPR